jgi:hypothetical protein
MTKLMEILVECTDVLEARSSPSSGKHEYAGSSRPPRTLRDLEKEGDKIFRDAISALFHDDAIDAKTICSARSEVLEDLENAIDHCDHVATPSRTSR